ncbi:protein ALP1-like [Temnothorax curvispinosus]|uniref:Protein ALP1-like n=1 Tax=Temnothorax curvispinosus TaxID=300111 RepID=A0A6J1QVL1_9HYME|nr:protein ALP1-like [Temnothorax curvispinosus]
MMHRDEEKYFDFFRMHLQSLNELFTLIKPHITKQTVVRTPIPAKTRFEICICYLTTGDSFQSLSYAFRVAPNTISKIVSETCQVIWDVLAEIVFPEPTEQLWYQKACDYEDLWDFPNCIGSIDGKHVVLQAPYKSGSIYYNYKGQHSIVLLAITDANGLFTVVDIGAEGRRSHGGIFMHSDLGISLNNNEVSLPPSRQLEENGPNLPYVLVGDEAFALTNYMMRPYSRRNDLDLSEKVYNYRHCRARRNVECSFGVLAARWRVYRKPMETSVTTSVKVVQATVCLHNFLMAKDITRSLQERQYSQFLPAERDAPAHALHDLHVQYVNINNATGIRDAFKQYFNTTGVIEQQWERALQNNF